MRYLFTLLLFAATNIRAQKDYDFTINTEKSLQIKSADTLELNLSMIFEKKSNVLKVTPAINETNSIEYKVGFQGVSFSTGCPVLMYKILEADRKELEEMFIFINPIEPTVIFMSDLSFTLFH